MVWVRDYLPSGSQNGNKDWVGTRLTGMEEAVLSGNLQRVEELIQSGVGANVQHDVRGCSLLMQAISKSFKDIALALLSAGADMEAKDDSGCTALHWACIVGSKEVVQELVDRGCELDVLDVGGRTPLWYVSTQHTAISMRLLRAGASCIGLPKGEVNELFRHACEIGDLLAVETLLKNGCSVTTLSSSCQHALLHYACQEGNMLVAGTLVVNDCSVSILSGEEQYKLYWYACHEGSMRLAGALLKDGCGISKLTDAEVLSAIKQLPQQDKEDLLYRACSNGDIRIVECLIAAGCNVNCMDYSGDTPIIKATREGHEKVVKKLILAGANLAVRNHSGDTALHYAATCNHIQCEILLCEGGASAKTKNQFSETAMDIATPDFREAVEQARSFTTRKALCIIGNAQGGKSTLIASLQAERTGVLGRFFNRFRRVDDRLNRTAGIETVSYCSQKYGEVLFFDFAGQDDYHGPHQMFLESILSKPGVSMTLLLVIKATETEEAISHQLHRWLTPVALMSTTASPPQVIIIGSFLDKVKFKKEAIGKLEKCIVATRKNLEELPLKFVGSCFLNCRQPQSEGIVQLCSFFQSIPVPEFKATHTSYSLAWVLSQIRSSIKAQALQLQEFSVWIVGYKDNLPQTLPSPEEVCQDLSAAGHVLYLPNKEDSQKSWLVLDLPGILRDVYGTLFSHSEEIVNEFGLLHLQHLVKLFSHLDVNLAMIQQLLISLEFCIPVEPSILKVDLSKLTQSEDTTGWLFFPSLVSANLQLTAECKESDRYLCWQLRTSKKHSVSARVLQTILLRLAANFVVKQHDEDGVQQHCCSIWWNGITWQSTDGVDITVHIVSNRVIQVMASSEMANVLHPYLTDVVCNILSTVHRISPKLTGAAYIVYPPKMTNSPEDIVSIPTKALFPVEGIQNSIKEEKEFTFSRKDGKNSPIRMSVANLFGECTPSLESIQKLLWTQLVYNEPHSPAEPSQPEVGTEESNPLTVPSDAQTLLDISSTPNLRDVDDLVVTAVAANWQRLALKLGVKGCVSEIVFKNHPNDYEGACRDMLDRWLRRDKHTGEEERTWSTLLAALDRAGFAELERGLRREYFTHK